MRTVSVDTVVSVSPLYLTTAVYLYASRSITDEDWDVLFKTNVLGYARCIKHALPHMRNNKPSDYVIENDQGQGVQVRAQLKDQ